MKVLQEITVWETDYTIPNHTYFVTDSKDKMYAYIIAGTKKITEFKNPLPFSTTRRKFKEVDNTFKYTAPEKAKTTGKTWQVAGSKGFYTVVEEAGELSCTCTGFKFYSKCKHIDSVKQGQTI
jgi:hypothetical protein